MTLPIPSDLPAIYARVCAKRPECRVVIPGCNGFESYTSTIEYRRDSWQRVTFNGTFNGQPTAGLVSYEAAALIFAHWSMVAMSESGYMLKIDNRFVISGRQADIGDIWRPDPISALAEYLENRQ